MPRDLVTSLVYTRSLPLVGRFAYYALKVLGLEIPLTVSVGRGLEIAHGGFGIVVHSRTRIGDHVKIYPGVTLGRADIHRQPSESLFEGIVVEDGVVLSAGCKVLCATGVLRVGPGTVVGANAVLLESTGENEIWAGVPARKIGQRFEHC
jgi:serine O-acetyltransferase